ncbi:Protein R02E4.2 [Aphelenchoides avenae]|nr:Protein R02E4.2 [Aphelenchus avenae]
MTNFMNYALIPIGVLVVVCMFLLACWVSALVSSSYGMGGWSVTGSKGGKNAALKRTMEIIEEQKVWFEEQKRLEQARGSTGGKSKLIVYKERRPVVRQTTVDQTRRPLRTLRPFPRRNSRKHKTEYPRSS